MNIFYTLTGHGRTAVMVSYETKDDLIDSIRVYKSKFDVTDVLSLEQLMELESEAALHFSGVAA